MLAVTAAAALVPLHARTRTRARIELATAYAQTCRRPGLRLHRTDRGRPQRVREGVPVVTEEWEILRLP